MTSLRARHRTLLLLGLFAYVLMGLAVTDIQSVQIATGPPPPCPASLLGADGTSAAAPFGERSSPGLTVLQGNAWMLPVRPLLIPYAFSTDRSSRLKRLVRTIRGCSPDVVLLQEVFENAVVELLARRLPDYRVITSGRSDPTGTVNVSGLVTLTRLPVERDRFVEFRELPLGAKLIERLGRKGFLSVEVAAPQFRGSIVNLHLYASRNAAETRIPVSQLYQVVAFVEEERRAGRRVLVGGDFNLTTAELAYRLPRAWLLSRHGPTYDPPGNRYTVEGANNTPGNHEDRRLGRGVRTVDHLLAPDTLGFTIRSSVLDTLLLSDHYFLEHVVRVSQL